MLLHIALAWMKRVFLFSFFFLFFASFVQDGFFALSEWLGVYLNTCTVHRQTHFSKKGQTFCSLFLPPLRPLRTAPLRYASSRGLRFFPLFSFLFSLFSALSAPVFHSSFALLFFLLPMFSSVFSFLKKREAKKESLVYTKPSWKWKDFFSLFHPVLHFFRWKFYLPFWAVFWKAGVPWDMYIIQTRQVVYLS